MDLCLVSEATHAHATCLLLCQYTYEYHELQRVENCRQGFLNVKVGLCTNSNIDAKIHNTFYSYIKLIRQGNYF